MNGQPGLFIATRIRVPIRFIRWLVASQTGSRVVRYIVGSPGPGREGDVPARAHLAVVFGLVVLASVFFGPRIYLDQALLFGDRLYYVDPTFRVAVEDVYTTQPHNNLNHIDHGLQIYPQTYYAQSSLDAGEVPWWNPYLAMGIPEVGLNAAVFEPVALALGRLVSVPTLINLRAVISLVIGGYGVFLLATTLGASRAAALFAGVAWAFSGWSIVWVGRTNFLAEMWMPWLLWAIERLLRRPSVAFVGVAALFAAFSCLTSHPQTGVQIFAVVGVYAFARLLGDRETRSVTSGRLGLVALAVVLGVGVALVQLVPMAELVWVSDLPATGRGRVREAANALGALWYGLRGDWEVIARDFPTMVIMVAPGFLGSPVDLTYWWDGYNLLEMMVYPGLAPLFFAGYAATRGRGRPRIGVWLFLAAVSFGAAYALPVFNLVNHLPVLRLANNGRLRFVVRFALIMAAAFGLDRFLADVAARRIHAVRWLGGFATLILAMPALTYLALWQRGYALPMPSATLGREAGVILVLAALIALGVLAGRAKLDRRAFVLATVAVAFVDAFWHFSDFNRTVPREHVFPETPVVAFLKNDRSLYRVSSGPSFMLANTKLPYRIFDVDLFDVLNLRRYTALQQTVNRFQFPADASARFFIFHDPVTYRGLMSLMNVKYVFMPPRGIIQGDTYATLPWCRVAYDREVLIYENLDVLPRAFLVDRASVVTPEAALAAVTRADFDPRAEVLLEDASSPRLAGGGRGAPGTAEVVALSANRVVVRAEAQRAAYLVLSEVNYPGWRAQVDGRDAPVYQADYLFRAVHLGAGRHEIAFTFMPTSYRFAIAGSLLALSAVLGCLLWGAVVALTRRRRHHGSVMWDQSFRL